MLKVTMIVESHEQVERNLKRVLTDDLDRTQDRMQASIGSILACNLRGLKDPHRPVTITLILEPQDSPLPQPHAIEALAAVC
jgi:hypothetical protein